MDGDNLVWAACDGYIVAETEKAVGIARKPRGDVEYWLPKGQVNGYKYDDGGDNQEVRKNVLVRSIELPAWLAEQRDLEVMS